MPSRGRPQNIERFISAWHETKATEPVIVRVDEDDAELQKYQGIAYPKGWELSVGPRISCSPSFNEVFESHPEAGGYGIFGDDAMPITPYWDRILSETAGSDGIAYANDGITAGTLIGHGVIGGDLARAIGWLMLPSTKRLYGDKVLHDIGAACGLLRYRSDVLIEHWHFSNGKAPMDATYAKPEALRDRVAYYEWRNGHGFADTVQKAAA